MLTTCRCGHLPHVFESSQPPPPFIYEDKGKVETKGIVYSAISEKQIFYFAARTCLPDISEDLRSRKQIFRPCNKCRDRLGCFCWLEKQWRSRSVIYNNLISGSPGLVVMGGDSCSEGCGFKSQCRILDGHDIFSHIFAAEIVMFVWKDENKWKRGRG